MTSLHQRRTTRKSDKSCLWRVEVLGGLDLLRANYAGFSFPPHSHEQFMIAITEDGIGLPRFRGAEHRVRAGDILVLNPGEVHSGGPKAGYFWRYRAFYPPAELMRRIAQELSRAGSGIPQFDEDILQDPRAVAKLREAHSVLEGTGSALEAESLLIEAFVSLIEHHAVGSFSIRNEGNEHRAVKRAKEYLDAFPMENISLEWLSHESGLSVYHFCRVFRRETGLSPHRYQILRRVNLAKNLIAEGVPISQVAVETGFYDQPHLTRHFKRVFGVTPGMYSSY